MLANAACLDPVDHVGLSSTERVCTRAQAARRFLRPHCPVEAEVLSSTLGRIRSCKAAAGREPMQDKLDKMCDMGVSVSHCKLAEKNHGGREQMTGQGCRLECNLRPRSLAGFLFFPFLFLSHATIFCRRKRAVGIGRTKDADARSRLPW